jgi:RNA polymerase primary sigma factor
MAAMWADEVALDTARNRLASHRLLSVEEEGALALLAQAGDREARNRLIVHNTRLVYAVARKYFSHDPALEFDDLVQEGLLGLMRAVDKFDPARGGRLSTYALWWIRQTISRAVANSGQIRVSVHVAQGPGHTTQHLQEAARQARQVWELDAPVSADGDGATLGELVASEADTEATALEAVLLEQALAGLPELPRKALEMTLSGETRREIGRQLGLSHGYVWYAVMLARKALGETCPAVGD